MIRKIKNIVMSLLILVNFSAVLSPVMVHAADPADDACAGLQQAGVECNTNTGAANNAFGKIIQTVINILSIIVGAVSVIMIIVGGFRYVISGGDANGVQGAKNTIIYAVIGLVVVLFAQIIVRFIFSNATR
jgi:hypothetical protein